MAGRRVVLTGLVLAGGGAGYYFYNAGGDPKVAQKTFEADANRLTNKVQEELPGKAKEAKKDAESAAEQARSKLTSAFSQAEDKTKAAGKDAEQKLEQARKETGAQLTAAVDKFDKTVGEGVSKTKSGISSWFGGGK